MDTKAVYQSLRQELLDAYHWQTNLVTLTLTVTGAIIGFGFTSDSQIPLIFLLPLLIIWLSLMQLANSLYTVFTISVFIRKFIEAKSDVAKWETEISSLRRHLRGNKKDFKPLQRFNPITTLYVYQYGRALFWMGIICIFLCFSSSYYWKQSGVEFYVSVIASDLSLIFWLFVWWWRLRDPIRFVSNGDFEKELETKWPEYSKDDE